MKIVLHSTNCPQCSVLKKKLESKGISYMENNDANKMSALGIDEVPVLEVDGKLLKFPDAVKWVNESGVVK